MWGRDGEEKLVQCKSKDETQSQSGRGLSEEPRKGPKHIGQTLDEGLGKEMWRNDLPQDFGFAGS